MRCEQVRNELLANSLMVSDMARRHVAACGACRDLLASFVYMDQALQRCPAWNPPPGFGRRLAASLPPYESFERFRLRMPSLPAGAVAGLAAAVVGATGEGITGRTSVTPWLDTAVALGVGGWFMLKAFAGTKQSTHRT